MRVLRSLPKVRDVFITTVLPLGPASPAAGRRFVGEALSDWPPDVVGVAVLLTSELVTNAVVHANSEVELIVHDSDSDLVVSVTDECAHLALVIQPTGSLIDQGRGLSMVQDMSDDCGVAVNGHRKTVWFSLNKTLPDPSPSPQ